MVEYAKKTVADLTEILKSRSLPTTGKKADLVARLQEADKAAESNEEIKASPAPATAAPPAQNPAEPQAPPSDPQPEPTTTEDPPTAVPADSPSANTDTALASSVNYALNLPSSVVDDEMAKRKARAERFGTGAAPTNGDATTTESAEKTDEAAQNLERAKRFGTGENAMEKLDQALSTDRERGAKRKGGADGAELEDPGLIRKFRGRGGFRGGPRRKVGGPQGGGPRPAAYGSEKDRAAADARKKRFAGGS